MTRPETLEALAGVLAEHRLTWWAVYPWNGGFEVAPRCTCGVLWSAGDREDPRAQIAHHDAHLATALLDAIEAGQAPGLVLTQPEDGAR